jgi:hypothetical protein
MMGIGGIGSHSVMTGSGGSGGMVWIPANNNAVSAGGTGTGYGSGGGGGAACSNNNGANNAIGGNGVGGLLIVEEYS